MFTTDGEKGGKMARNSCHKRLANNKGRNRLLL